MGPGGNGGGKRKRNDRNSGGESMEGGRPSPHRPAEASLMRRDHNDDRNNNNGHHGNMSNNNNNNRRGGRGGGGRGGQGQGNQHQNGRPQNANVRRDSRINHNDVNNVPVAPRPPPMSAPPNRPSNATTPVSQPATPIQPNMPSTITQELQRPQKDILPFHYQYLTEDIRLHWKASGHDQIVAECTTAFSQNRITDLAAIFHELIRAVLDDKIPPEDAGSCVKALLQEVQDISAVFLDTLSMITDSEPFDPILQTLVATSGISEDEMRKYLDASLLQSLGLTRHTFIKAGIRQVTNLLYRQANHNLLREESEGYTKLVTELFTTGSSTNSTDALPPNIAEEAFEKVKGLIGTFDLDVGRVLDVTLDVFATMLIKQFRFYIKFLRVSSWWPSDNLAFASADAAYNDSGLPRWALPGASEEPMSDEEERLNSRLRTDRDIEFWERAREIGVDAYFEIGGRRVANLEDQKALLNGHADDKSATSIDLQWIEATGTMPPVGNRVAAQLLGFKFRFYSSAVRDNELPPNVIYLAALMIKIGFISLRDLYSHLWPDDEQMEVLRTTKAKELAEKERASRPGASNNALMSAGALADDTVPATGRPREPISSKAVAPNTSAIDATDKDEFEDPTDQKVQLLTNLLTIGALPEALFLLGKYPWIPETYPTTYDLIHRILHYSIDKVFGEGQDPIVEDQPPPPKKAVELDASLPHKFRHVDPVIKKRMRWPYPDRNDVDVGANYRFYYDEWADNIPVCQNVDDIFTLCNTLLNISGVNIGRDATLLSKLATIGVRSLGTDRTESNLARWQELLKRLLVPALSLTSANTSAANEIYDMLRFYPPVIRYNIYAEWFEGQTSRLPAMQAAFARARLETLRTMKRISTTNLTPMAKALAKTAYASPGIVFKVALSQIESYSNLTEVVVECAKYFTDLGYDVLVWSLMTALGGQTKSRTREDDALLTSRWLISLARFTGRIYKRYSLLNLNPILEYVNHQMVLGNSTDLIILEQLIAQMSGVVSGADFTDAQLLAMTGGELLRRQTLISLQDKRYELLKTTKRLMKSLTDSKLAGQLLVAIAQHRESAIYAVPDNEAHVKFLATLIDDTQQILFQYLDLLRSNLTVQEFDALVPSTGELMSEYGLHPSLAFMLGRASFAAKLATAQNPVKVELKRTSSNDTETKVDVDGDAVMSTTDNVETAETMDAQTTTNSPSEEMVDVVQDTTAAVQEPWHDELRPLVVAVQSARPAETWSFLTPEFYATFWQLSLSDINLPMDSYTAENTRLSREISDIIKSTSRSSSTNSDAARKSLEVARDDLLRESKQEMIKFERSRARLNKEKISWFPRAKAEGIMDSLWEECFLPRLVLSPSDADYCFKMIKFLHNNGTPNFRTLVLYVRFFRTMRLRTLIFTCTVREAENLGRFIKNVLTDVARWHKSKTVYEKEALGIHKDLIGFAKKISDDGKPDGFLDWEEFRKLIWTWHKNLHMALKLCLTGKEWTHIRNGIEVLKACVDVFPAINFHGTAFQDILAEIGASEKTIRDPVSQEVTRPGRDDLSLTAFALLPALKKRQPKWVMIQAFVTGTIAGDPSINNESKSGTPQPSALKATAPEFKPSSQSTSSRAAKANDVEDGEVDDAKLKQQGTSSSTKTENRSSTPKPDLIKPDARKDTPSAQDRAPRSLELRDVPTRSSSRADASRASSSTRAESTRESSSRANTSSNRDKSNPALPVRPELPFPSHSEMDRHRGRLGRDEPSPRHDRVSSTARESSRRNTPDVPDTNVSRSSNDRYGSTRDARDGQDSRRRDGHRDYESREGRLDRPHLESRTDSSDRREVPDVRGNTAATSSDRCPTVNPERLRLLSPARDVVMVNPARAALISGSGGAGDGQSAQARPSSRAHSPSRSERSHDRDRRDGEPPNGSNRSSNSERSNRRRDENGTPSGPRNDRAASDRSRGSFVPTSQPPPQMDPNHGRLSRDQDANYGRLNPVPSTSDAPSGPRSENNSSNRNSSNVNRSSNNSSRYNDDRNTREEPHHAPASYSDRGAPTGPSADRSNNRNLSTSQAPAPSSANTNLAGLHPSRAGLVETTQRSAPATPMPPPAPSGPAVHPSRAEVLQLGSSSQQPQTHSQTPQYPSNRQSQSMPQNMNMNNSRNVSGPDTNSSHNMAPMNNQGSPALPQGPRNNRAPSGTNNTYQTPAPTPTGPSSQQTHDNQRNDRRKFGGLQNIISASPGAPQQISQSPNHDRNDRQMSIKGRGTYNNSRNMDMPSNANQPPPPPPGQPPQSAAPSRRDFSQQQHAPQQQPYQAPQQMLGPGLDLVNPDRLRNLADVVPDGGQRSEQRNMSGSHRGRDERRGGDRDGARRSSRSPRRGQGQGQDRNYNQSAPLPPQNPNQAQAPYQNQNQAQNPGDNARDSRGGRDGNRDRDGRHGSARGEARGYNGGGDERGRSHGSRGDEGGRKRPHGESIGGGERGEKKSRR